MHRAVIDKPAFGQIPLDTHDRHIQAGQNIVKDAQGGGELPEVALVVEGEYKRNYNAGDVFDASGITVYVQYSDGSKVPVI